MARDFNQIRNTNAKLVNATIDKYGASYPAQSPWRADGFNKVFVETEGANPTQKDFLEGNSSVYVYAIGSNIGSLLPYSLASFTNIKELYLFSHTMVNIGAIDNDYLTYLNDSDLKVYVPNDLLQSYINAYGGTGKHLENRFDEITDDYPLTVSGSGDLTSQELTNQLMNNYESVDRTNCTKLIIQGFTNSSSVIWGYDFSEILPNLNSNIWVNGVKFDFSVLNIIGSGTLTEVDIDNAISDIAISNRGGVLEVKISGYSDMSVALGYDYEDLPNLEYLWLDNVRYEIETYQGVEYIESFGNEYIKTGHIFTSVNIKYETELASKVLTNQNYCGSIANGTWYRDLPFSNTDNHYQISNRGGVLDSSINVDTDFHSFIAERKSNGLLSLTIDENTNSATYSNNTLSNIEAYLFANNSGGNASGKASAKIKYFKAYDNGNIAFNYVPVLKNNEYFMLDLKDYSEHHNDGLGSFSGGEEIDKIYYAYINATYFYSLSNLETEYNANLNQTFYLDYNGTLPSYPNYQLTYYTDINCTTSILPTALVSGTRYYVKAVMVTLVIQGSGTLTSAIVEEQVAKAGSSVTKVVIPDTFTARYDAGCLDVIDNYLDSNDITLDFYVLSAQAYSQYWYYSKFDNVNGKIKHLIFRGTTKSESGFGSFAIKSLLCTNITSLINSRTAPYLETYIFPLATSGDPQGNGWGANECHNLVEFYAPNLTYSPLTNCNKLEKVYLPSFQTIGQYCFYGCSKLGKIFFEYEQITLADTTSSISNLPNDYKMYFKATDLVNEVVKTNFSSISTHLVGVVDGNDLYKDIAFSYGYKLSMNYPKLSSTLTLDTTNGHLMENGVDLFTGYTATWYSNEDCTTTIQPSAITSDMTVYVKLTAI